MKTIQKRTTLTKKEVIIYTGLTAKSLALRLNKIHYEEMVLLGYNKHSKILPEEVVKKYIGDWSYENSVNILIEIYQKEK